MEQHQLRDEPGTLPGRRLSGFEGGRSQDVAGVAVHTHRFLQIAGNLFHELATKRGGDKMGYAFDRLLTAGY